jgi:hypothetical protein
MDINYSKLYYAAAYDAYLEYNENNNQDTEIDLYVDINCNVFYEKYTLYADDIIGNMWTNENRDTDCNLIKSYRFSNVEEAYGNVERVYLMQTGDAPDTLLINNFYDELKSYIFTYGQLSQEEFINNIGNLQEEQTDSQYENLDRDIFENMSKVYNLNVSNYIDLAINFTSASNHYNAFNSNYEIYYNRQQELLEQKEDPTFDYHDYLPMSNIYTSLVSFSNQFYSIYNDYSFESFSIFSNFYISLTNNYGTLTGYSNQIQTNLSTIDSNILFRLLFDDPINYIESTSNSLGSNELQINSFSNNWPTSNVEMSNNFILQRTLHPDYNAVIRVNSNADIYYTIYLDYTNTNSLVFNQLETISNNVFTYSSNLRKLLNDPNFEHKSNEINAALSNAKATFPIIDRISDQEDNFNSNYNVINQMYTNSQGHFTKASTIDALTSNIQLMLNSNVHFFNISSNLYTSNQYLNESNITISSKMNQEIDEMVNDVFTIQSNLTDIKSNCSEIGTLLSEQFYPNYSNILNVSNIINSTIQDIYVSNLGTGIIEEFQSKFTLMIESNTYLKNDLLIYLQSSKEYIQDNRSIQKNVIDDINSTFNTRLYFINSDGTSNDNEVLSSTSNEYTIENNYFFSSNYDVLLSRESVILESRHIGLRNVDYDSDSDLAKWIDWTAQTTTGTKFIASNQFLTIDLDFSMSNNKLYVYWDRVDTISDTYLTENGFSNLNNNPPQEIDTSITQEIFVSKTNIFNNLVESKKCVLTEIPQLDEGKFQTDDNSIYYKNIFTSIDYTYYDKVDILVSIEKPSVYRNINIWKKSSDANTILMDFSMFSNRTVFEVKVKISLQLDISNQDELLFYDYPDNTYTILVEKPTVQTKYDSPGEYRNDSNAPITIFDYFDETTRFGYIRSHKHTIVQYTNKQNYTITLDTSDHQYGNTLHDTEDGTGNKYVNIFKTILIFKKEDEIFTNETLTLFQEKLQEKLKSIGYGRLYINNPLDDPTYDGYMLKIETIDTKPYLIYDTINTSDLKGLFRIEQLSLNATYGLRYRDSTIQNYEDEREVKIGNILELESIYWKMIGNNDEFKLETMDGRIMSYNNQNYDDPLYLIGIDDHPLDNSLDDYTEITFSFHTGSGGAIQFRTNINGSTYVLNYDEQGVIKLEPLRTDIFWIVYWYYETYFSIKYMDGNYLGYNNYKELFLNLGEYNTITTSETNSNLFTLKFRGKSLIPQTPYNYRLTYNSNPATLSFQIDDDIDDIDDDVNIDFIKLYNISLVPNFPHIELSSHKVSTDTYIRGSYSEKKEFVLKDEQQIIKTNIIDKLNIGLKVVKHNISSQFASSNPNQSQTENSPSRTKITLEEYDWNGIDYFFSKINNMYDSGVVDQVELIGGNNNSGNVIISEDRYFEIIKPSKVSNIRVRKMSDIAEFTFDSNLDTSVEYYKLYKNNGIDAIASNGENTFELTIDYNTIYGEYYITANNSNYTEIVSDESYFTIVQPIKPTIFSIQHVSEDTYRFTWNSPNVSDPNRKYRIYRKDNDSDSTYQIFDGTEDIIKLKSYLQRYISKTDIFGTFAITEGIIDTGFESEYSDPIVIREPHLIPDDDIAINYMNAIGDDIGVYQISWISSNDSDLYTYDIYYEPDNTPATRQQINSLPLSEKTLQLNNTIFTGSWFVVENIFDESTYDSIDAENKLVIEPKVLGIESIDARENPIYKINFKFTNKDETKSDVRDCFVDLRRIGNPNVVNLPVSKVDNRLYRYLSVEFPEFQTDEQEILVSLEIKVYDVSRLVHDTKFLNISHIVKDAEITSTLDYISSTYSTARYIQGPTYLRYPSTGLVFKYSGLFNNYVRSEIINQIAGEETLIFAFYVDSFQKEDVTLFSIGNEQTRNLKVKLGIRTKDLVCPDCLVIYGNNGYQRVLTKYQIKLNLWYHIIITNIFGETTVHMYFNDKHHTDHDRSEPNENTSIALSGNIETEISIGFDKKKNLKFNGKITDIAYYTRKLDYSEIIRAFSPSQLDPWWFRSVEVMNLDPEVNQNQDEIITLEYEIQKTLFDLLQKSKKIRLSLLSGEVKYDIDSVSETNEYKFNIYSSPNELRNKFVLYFINNSLNYFDKDVIQFVLKSGDNYIFRSSTQATRLTEYPLLNIQELLITPTFFNMEFQIEDEFDIFDLSTSGKEFYLYMDNVVKYHTGTNALVMTDIENDPRLYPVKFKAEHEQNTNDYQQITLTITAPATNSSTLFSQQLQFDIEYSKYDGKTNGVYIKKYINNEYLFVNDVGYLTYRLEKSRFHVVYDFTPLNFREPLYLNTGVELKDENFNEKTGMYVQIPARYKNNFISLQDSNFSGFITTGGKLNIKFAFRLETDTDIISNLLNINNTIILKIVNNRLSIDGIDDIPIAHNEIVINKWYYLTFILNTIESKLKLFIFSYANGLSKLVDYDNFSLDYTTTTISYSFTTSDQFEITDVSYLTHNVLENRDILHLVLINTVDPWWDRVISAFDTNSYFRKLLKHSRINQDTILKLVLTGVLTPQQKQTEIDIEIIDNTVSSIIKLEGLGLDNNFIMITDGMYIILKDSVEDLYVYINHLGYINLYALHEFKRERYQISISKFNIRYSLFELEGDDDLFEFNGNVRLVNEVVKLSTIYKNISTVYSLLLSDNNNNGLQENDDNNLVFSSEDSIFLSYNRETITDTNGREVSVWDSGDLGEDLYRYETSGYGTFMILLKNNDDGHTGIGLGRCLSKDENNKLIHSQIDGSNNRNNIFKLKPSGKTRECMQIVFDDTGEPKQYVRLIDGELIVSSGDEDEIMNFKMKMINENGIGDWVHEIDDDVYDNPILDRSELTESYIVSKTVDAFTFSSDTNINLESNKKIEFNTPNLLLNGIQLHEYVRYVIFSEQYIQYANQDLHMVEKLIEPLSNLKSFTVGTGDQDQEETLHIDEIHSSNISFDMTKMYDSSLSSFSVSNIFTSNISSHLSHIRHVEEITRYPVQYANYPIHNHPPEEDTHTEINDINISYCNCFHHAITISARDNIYIKNTSDIENIEFNRDSNNSNLKSLLGVYISNIVGNAVMPVAPNEISQLGVVSTIEEPIGTGTQSINTLVEDWWNQPIPKEILSDSFNLVINDDKQKTYSWKILRNTRIVGSSYKSEPLNETYTLNYYKWKCISLGDNCLGFSHNKEEALIQLKTDTSELIPNVSYDSYFKI